MINFPILKIMHFLIAYSKVVLSIANNRAFRLANYYEVNELVVNNGALLVEDGER